MAISGPNFKMNKQSKRELARILDPHKRGAIKRSLIQAQVQSEMITKRPRENNKPR
mgnify:CR=1 FL=1